MTKLNQATRSATFAAATVALLTGIIVRADEVKEDAAAESRLKVMMGFAKSFSGTRPRDGAKIQLMDKALLRWTNPYSNVKDGVLVGWLDEAGCPVAIAQIYLLPDTTDSWGIELQSLSQMALKIKCDGISIGPWRPNKPGVEWQTFPDDRTVPASSERLRLSQMRLLAKRFRCKDNFEESDESHLRLLPKTVIRYSDSSKGIVDGAVFALVHGTDPELIVVVEARELKNGKSAYSYALAPMTGYELKAYLDDELVYHKPRISSNLDTDIFWQRNLVDPTPPRPGFLQQLFNRLR